MDNDELEVCDDKDGAKALEDCKDKRMKRALMALLIFDWNMLNGVVFRGLVCLVYDMVVV